MNLFRKVFITTMARRLKEFTRFEILIVLSFVNLSFFVS